MLNAKETVTLYSKRYDRENRSTTWQRTVISGVSWQGCQRITTGENLTSNDGYSVRVPVDHLPAGFLPKDRFLVLPERGRAEHWTAQNGDVVLLGSGPEVSGGITELTKNRSDYFTVTAVHTDNLGRRLSHLRLEGK